MKYLVFGIKIISLTLIVLGLFTLNTKYKILNTGQPQKAVAQTMSNSDYILRMGNLNSISGKPTGANYKVSFTVGQTGANLFSGTNYKVRAGFQYIYSIIPFRFTISNTFIDFGILTAKNFSTRNNLLTVSNGSANGYQVTASQNHNLRVNATGWEIPQTACDSGFSCTTTTANKWTDFLNSYGFGYNCNNVSGTDCSSDFTDSTYFRPFVSSPSAVTIMSSTNVGRTRKSTITYQVNISLVQSAGLYTNIINYIATPNF